MFKKIISLSIVTAVVLIGAENVIAQEERDIPEQMPRRRQVQEDQPRQREQVEQPRRRQAEIDLQTQLDEANKKIKLMEKKLQQELAQSDMPRGRVGRRLQQTRPRRNQPMRRMFDGRGQGLQGRGIGGWNRRFQCNGLCPCCQRGMCPWYNGFSGRGIGGMERGFRSGGMMGRGGQDFRGRSMMGWGGPGFRGGGMIDGQGPDMPAVPDVRPFPQNPPQEDVLRPVPPMQRRGMGRPDPDMPSPQEPPMQRRGMGRRGGGDWPREPEPQPENN